MVLIIFNNEIMMAEVNEKPNIKARFTQFFDEMNILKSEKNERVKTAMDFRKWLNDFYEGILLDLINGDFFGHYTKYIEEFVRFYIDTVNKVDKNIVYDSDVIAKANQVAEQVMNTTKNIIDYDPESYVEYHNAVLLGIEIDEEIVPNYVKDSLSADSWRVEETAENETLWVHNYTRHKQMVDSGHLTHTWETMRDERVRPQHVAVDGQTKPINEPFIVDGYKLMFPGDTLTSNPPGDLTILCRCVEV
jgi:hypothetical protein